MKQRYDVTLIDSRTGETDVADVCTLLLPDTLVTCFTLSDQGIEGAAGVARDVHGKRRQEPIRVLPVPMRVDQAEKEKRDAGRALARWAFGSLPDGMSGPERGQYWADVEVPYEAFYAYEEILATFGDVPGSARSVVSSYERLARIIMRDQEIELRPIPDAKRKLILEQFRRQLVPTATEVLLEYGGPEQAWAEWIEQVLAAAEIKVVDLRALDEDLAGSLEAARDRVVLNVSAGRLGVEITPSLGTRSLPLESLFVSEAENSRPDDVASRLLRLVGRETTGIDGAWHDAPFPRREPRWSQLAPRNPRFMGRSEVMGNLRKTFRQGNSLVVLTGLGGVGKTQLALEYAHRFRSSYELIWWVDAERPDLVEGAIADLAERVGTPIHAERGSTLTSTLNALRRGEPTREWLLVLDNAEKPRDVANVLAGHLPGSFGDILVTSRSTDWAGHVQQVVPVYTRPESTQRLRDGITTLTEGEANDVADLLGDLPLAVDAAIGSLGGGADVQGYLRSLEDMPSGTPGEVTKELAATFRVALERLHEQSPGAHRLLQIFSVMAPQISLDFVFGDAMADALVALDSEVSDRNMRRPLLQRLARLSLVREDTRNRQVEVHRLLQSYVRSQMSDEDIETVRHHVHRVLADSRPGPDVDANKLWPSFRLLWPHLAPSRAVGCPDPGVRRLLNDRIRYLWLRGDLTQGEMFARQVAEQWESLLTSTLATGSEDEAARVDLRRNLYRLRHNLGNILRDQARFAEAHALDERNLRESTDLLGEGHAQTLCIAGSFAADLRALGRYDEALTMERRTSRLWAESFGELDPLTLSASNNLAVSLRAVGATREARDIDERLHALMVGEFGPDDVRTLRLANAVGRDLRESGEYDRSVRWLEGVVASYAAATEQDVRGTLIARANLAASLRSAGDVGRAGPLLEDTYQQFEEFYGRNKPETLACRLNRAVNLLAGRQVQRAIEELEVTAQAYERLGDDHPLALLARGGLAGGWRAAGEPVRAAELIATVADRCRNSLGAGHPHAIVARMNLAVCLDDLGSAEAAQIMTEATDALTSALGSDHPESLAAQVSSGILETPRRERTAVPGPVGAVLNDLAVRIGEKHPTVVELRAGRLVFRLIDPGDPF